MTRAWRYSVLLVAFFSFSAQALSFQAYLRNREGVRELNKKSHFLAQQKFMKALEEDPLNPVVQLNLARTFEDSENFDKAEQAYRATLQLLPQDSPLRFEALFNWAGVLAKLKRIEDALGVYQLALEIQPDSIEVKTMIELLWQGGGGGGGEGEQNQDPQDGEGKQQQQGGEPQQQQQQQQKSKPQQEISPEDVKRILDEIKNQEQNIRANDYERGQKEMPRDKDW